MPIPFSLFPVVAGVDIQQDAIRLVRAVHKKQGLEITQLAAVDLQPNVFNEDMVEDWEALSHALNELVITHRLQKTRVAIALPVSQVLTGVLPLPMARRPLKIKEAICDYLKNSTNEDPIAWQIDFSCGSLVSEEARGVFFAATRRDYLLNYIRCINAAGVEVKTVDVDVYALQRVLTQGLQEVEVGCLAVLHVQPGLTLLYVWQDGRMIWYSRSRENITRYDAVYLQGKILDELARANLKIDGFILSAGEEMQASWQQLTWAYPFHLSEALSGVRIAEQVPLNQDRSAYQIAAGLLLGETKK